MRIKLRLIAIGLIIIGCNWLATQARLVSVPIPQPQLQINESIELKRITYYQAVAWQTDEDPFTSSCGPNLDKQIAVSRDLMGSIVNCGDQVQVWSSTHGYIGSFTVWDVTNARFTSTIDILTDNPYDWGKTSGHAVIRR